MKRTKGETRFKFHFVIFFSSIVHDDILLSGLLHVLTRLFGKKCISVHLQFIFGFFANKNDITPMNAFSFVSCCAVFVYC